MDKLLIALVVAIPLIGYIAFFDSGKKANVPVHQPTLHQVDSSAEPMVTFVPAGYRRLDENYDIVLDVSVLPGTLNSLWAEYGESATMLDRATPRQSNELGMGTAGEYGWYSIIISAEQLEPGKTYFYRIAGESIDGKVLYSGLNHFTAGK